MFTEKATTDGAYLFISHTVKIVIYNKWTNTTFLLFIIISGCFIRGYHFLLNEGVPNILGS